MRKWDMLGMVVVVGLIGLMTGCATVDLKSGRQFSGQFATPPEGKTLVYVVRNDNFMATKLPHIYVRVTRPDDKGEPAEPYKLAALLDKDLFVPLIMDPGTYLIKAGAREIFTFKPNEVRCVEVGGKFRGISINVVEEMEKEECLSILAGRDESVQAKEAINRLGWDKEGKNVYYQAK